MQRRKAPTNAKPATEVSADRNTPVRKSPSILRRTCCFLLLLVLCIVLGLLVQLEELLPPAGPPIFDVTTAPTLPSSSIEVMAELPHPPGNVAISEDGRIFFTFHPEIGYPDGVKLAEWRGKNYSAFPNMAAQEQFGTILAVKQHHSVLYIADYGNHGVAKPRLLRWSLQHTHFFEPIDLSPAAGLGSMINDFNVDIHGDYAYLADSSVFANSPGIVVVDLRTAESWRVLDNVPAVRVKGSHMSVYGRPITLFNHFYLRTHIDSIALDRHNEFLYFGCLTESDLYRIHTRYLKDRTLDDYERNKYVEYVGRKGMSDGITVDREDNVYLTDAEHSAINVLPVGDAAPLYTLVQDDRLLRWPDGVSFGPGGYLYVSCSAIMWQWWMEQDTYPSRAPFHIVRIPTKTTRTPCGQ